MVDQLTLDDFDYPFPEHLIAHEPLPDRSGSRLLIHAPNVAHRHVNFSDLTSEVPPGTLLVANDSRVIPARLLGHLDTGGKVELFLMEERSSDSAAPTTWSTLARPLRKLRPGLAINFDGALTAKVVSIHQGDPTAALALVTFNRDPTGFAAWVQEYGFLPLPPYIKRPNPVPASRSPDRLLYQTVYARDPGSVAAPTAGLHFSNTTLSRLAEHGIDMVTVTLHVGGGTFLPVKSASPSEHRMHQETFSVPAAALVKIESARARGQKVIAVGTTTLRALESLGQKASELGVDPKDLTEKPLKTQLFIWPKTRQDRYVPCFFDGLITNFHQPRSTLFMLISALIGLDQAKQVYAEAVAHSYRLYSYGDASLLFWNNAQTRS